MNLKQLSAILGLSQTTVSRALNGYPEVSEKTRNRVNAAAQKHGYRANARAQSLATGMARSVAHVLPGSSSYEIVNPIFADFMAGANAAYAKNGYEVLVSIAPDHEEEATYRALAARGSVDGVIVHGPKKDDPRIDLLNDIGLPFVVHGRTGKDDGSYSWVDVNNQSAFDRATEFLIDLGHRRIGLINGDETYGFSWRRRLGWEMALTNAALPVDPNLARQGEMTELLGWRSARDMLAQDHPPTAFLVSSMVSALGVRRAIEEAGLRFGHDISVITHDDDLSYLGNGDDVPVYTATLSSVHEAGQLAAEMLLRRIKAPTSPAESHLLTAQLIVGQSTGPCKA